MESKPSSVPKQTILLDDYLLCFSEKQEIYVFDLVNSEWRTITPKNSNSISLQNTPIHITDQSSLIAFKHNFNQYNSYTNTSLYSLVIDKTQGIFKFELIHNSNSTLGTRMANPEKT